MVKVSQIGIGMSVYLAHPHLIPQLFKPVCECRMCHRSTCFPLSTSPCPSTPPDSLPIPSVQEQATPASVTPYLPSNQGSRIASTSRIPYQTPLAISLPVEVLLEIFHLARPPIIRRKRGWYARLCLVHSRWKEAAQECLIRLAVLTKSVQIEKLKESIKKGWSGGKVEEIVLDLREMSSGKSDPKVVSALSLSPTTLFASISSINTAHSSTLKVLRLVGFGNELLQKLPTTLFPSLDNLTTFEYSPIDSSYPPSSEGLLRLLLHAPRLETLILEPSNHSISFIADPERANPVVTQTTALLNLVAALDGILSTTPALARDNDVLQKALSTLRESGSPREARLKTLSLSALCFSSSFFLELVVNSFKSITSLSFKSIIIVGGGNDSVEFFTALTYLIDGLREFTWEDAIVSVAGLDHSLLPVEKFWKFLTSAKKVSTPFPFT